MILMKPTASSQHTLACWILPRLFHVKQSKFLNIQQELYILEHKLFEWKRGWGFAAGIYSLAESNAFTSFLHVPAPYLFSTQTVAENPAVAGNSFPSLPFQKHLVQREQELSSKKSNVSRRSRLSPLLCFEQSLSSNSISRRYQWNDRVNHGYYCKDLDRESRAFHRPSNMIYLSLYFWFGVHFFEDIVQKTQETLSPKLLTERLKSSLIHSQ